MPFSVLYFDKAQMFRNDSDRLAWEPFLEGRWTSHQPSVPGIYIAVPRTEYWPQIVRLVHQNRKVRLLQSAGDARVNSQGEWSGWFWSVPIPEVLSTLRPAAFDTDTAKSSISRRIARVQCLPVLNDHSKSDIEGVWSYFLSADWQSVVPRAGGLFLMADPQGRFIGQLHCFFIGSNMHSVFRPTALHSAQSLPPDSFRWGCPIPPPAFFPEPFEPAPDSNTRKDGVRRQLERMARRTNEGPKA